MTQKEVEKTLDDMVRRIVDRFHPEKIILFGSYARDEFMEDSDFDILIVMPVQTTTRHTANEIDLALADRTMSLDIIVVTPEQFDRQKNRAGTIVYEAAREGKVMYERAA